MHNLKKLIIVILIIAIAIVGIIIIFLKNNYNNENIGDNKDIKEIEKYILNINTYEAEIEVNVKSNKNENKYQINQKVTENYMKQITNEPDEIKGFEIEYKDGILEIKDNNQKLSKIYKNYPYITDNNLFLTSFINNYKNSNNRTINEKNNQVILKINYEKNKYSMYQILYINKETLKPEHLEILDMNNNIKVYILYNEIKLNI